jgi:very-short-patch-repair endonuclease
MPPRKSLITGQQVNPTLLGRARKMRREMTPPEQKLWQRLRAGRLEGLHFRRQQVIGRYIVDFYCHAASLVVELDGSGHLDQESYDQKRDEFLEEIGLKVLRFYNSQVESDLDIVLGVILEACREQFVVRGI